MATKKIGTAARTAKAEKKVVLSPAKKQVQTVVPPSKVTATATDQVTAPKAEKAVLTPEQIAEKKAKKLATTQQKAFALGRRAYFTRWNKEKNEMTCLSCGEKWAPKFSELNPKRLVRGSWVCPKGCCILPPEVAEKRAAKEAERDKAMSQKFANEAEKADVKELASAAKTAPAEKVSVTTKTANKKGKK